MRTNILTKAVSRKILCAALAIAMIIMMMPMLNISVFAVDTISQPLNFIDGDDKTTYSTETNGVKWDESSKTLTLNGANINVTGDAKAESSANTQAVILLPSESTIVIPEGTTSTVSLDSTMTSAYAFAIESRGTLAISGKGTLNVNAKSSTDSGVKAYGISSSNKLTISDTTVNAFGQYKAIYKGNADTADIEISGAVVNAKCNTTDGDVKIEDNGMYAIHAEDGDIIIKNATVDVDGGAIGIISSKGKIDMSGSTVTVDSGTHCLNAMTAIDIIDSIVDATGHGYIEGSAGKNAKAIYSQGTIDISGNTNVTATCINDKGVALEGAKFYAIRSKGDITVTGNKAIVTAYATTAAFNLESGKTVTIPSDAVVVTGEDKDSATVKTGDVTTAVTSDKFASIVKTPLLIFAGLPISNNGYVTGSTALKSGKAHVQFKDEEGSNTDSIIDAKSVVVTLTDAKFEMDDDTADYLINSEIPVTVVLNGDNSMKLGDAYAAWIDCTGHEDVNAILVVEGSGSLKVRSLGEEDAMGLKVTYGDIAINGIKLDLEVTQSALCARNIYFNKSCDVKAVVTNDQDAIYADEEVIFNLTKGGKVYAESTGGAAVKVGSDDTIVLKDNNKITTPKNGYVYEDEDNFQYIAEKGSTVPVSIALIEYVDTDTSTKANTGDSNDIALFSILGILALCGAGFVGYKKREN